MKNSSFYKQILEPGKELSQFKEYLNSKTGIYLDIKINLINNLDAGCQSEEEQTDTLNMLEVIEYQINCDKDLENKSPQTQFQLLTTCSKISLAITLLSKDKNNTGEEALQKRLLDRTPDHYHKNILQAIDTLYPKEEGASPKAPIIGGVLNLMSIFGTDNIIDILQNRLRVLSYHEKKDSEESEVSILNGRRNLKNYFVLRDNETRSRYFLAGEQSLRSLYSIFDINISNHIEQDMLKQETKFKHKNNLKAQENSIDEVESTIETSLKDQEKLKEIKAKLKVLQEKNKDLKQFYNESLLDKIAEFEQKQDESSLFKGLLPTRGFINWFRDKDDLPIYLQDVLDKIKIRNEKPNEEESFALYLYFAQHHRIATSSITSVVENLKYLQTDDRMIQAKLDQKYISILDLIAIIDSSPNYYQEVDDKNSEIINNIEQTYKFNLSQTLLELRPIFLKSKRVISEEYKNLYVLYNTALTFSEQKIIKDMFKKRSFNITNYNDPLNTELVVANMKNMESITTLKETLKKLTLISRKLKYHQDQSKNTGLKKYTDNAQEKALSFEEMIPGDKEEFKKKIQEITPKMTKGQYLLIEDLDKQKQEEQGKENIPDIKQFLSKIEQSSITPQQKILRKFLDNKENRPYQQSELETLKDEQEAGLISTKSTGKMTSLCKKLDKFTKPKFLEELQDKLKFPHIIELNTNNKITKKQVQDKTYFHITHTKELEDINDRLNKLSRELKRINIDENSFMEHLMFIHEQTDKVLFTPRDNFDAVIETLNPEILKKTIQTDKFNKITIFDPSKTIRRYSNLLDYKNTEDHEDLLESFNKHIDKIDKLSETYNIDLSHLKRTVKILEKDKNHLASPVIYNYMQNIIALATEQHDQIDKDKIPRFAAQKRQKAYANFADKGKLDKELEEATKTIIEDIKEHTEKSKVARRLVNGVTQGTGKGNNRKRTRTYDTSTNLRNRNIQSFLGKKSMKSFLLGETENYEIPEYIKNNLKDDVNILRPNDYSIYRKKLKEIEKYINDNLIRL